MESKYFHPFVLNKFIPYYDFRCPLWSNSLQLHAKEVENRAKAAKKDIDPAIDLVHDPTKDLPQVRIIKK